jgi:predicted DNA-binding protein YlxM (UPF0122 family)
MARPNEKQARAMMKKIKSLIAQEKSIAEIARETNKSQQAVHAYLVRHRLETVHMRERRKKR